MRFGSNMRSKCVKIEYEIRRARQRVEKSRPHAKAVKMHNKVNKLAEKHKNA